MACRVDRDGFEGIDDEVQRLVARQCLDALTAELLLVISAHSRQKGLRQNNRVLNQIGSVEHQATTPGLAVQDGQSVRQA